MIWGHTVPGVSGHWFLLVVFCPSLVPLSLYSSLTLPHFYLFSFLRLSLLLSLVSFSLSVSTSLCLSPSASLFLLPLPPQPESSLSWPPGCPPVGEADEARWGQAVSGSGALTPPPSRTQEGGSVRSAWRLAWVPVISSAFGFEAQIAHQKG